MKVIAVKCQIMGLFFLFQNNFRLFQNTHEKVVEEKDFRITEYKASHEKSLPNCEIMDLFFLFTFTAMFL